MKTSTTEFSKVYISRHPICCVRMRKYILLFLIICTACGTIATPEFSIAPRPVMINIRLDQSSTEISPFSVESSVDRTHENICVDTSQRIYWEPGDQTETSQPHSIEVQIEAQAILRNNLFIFWNNASIEKQSDSQGHSIGAILAAPMHICFSTRMLNLGFHHAIIRIVSTSGKIHSYSWDFEIIPLERKALQGNLILTAEYLENNPQPTPDYIYRLETAST